MTCLLNSLEEKISGSVMFLTTAKDMWNILKIMYDNEKNLSRVFEIYERLFELKQGDRSMTEFYDKLKSLINELKMHQPAITDAATLRGYCQDLTVSKFLSGFSPSLRSQVRGQILRGEYFHVNCHLLQSYAGIFGADIFSAPFIEQSAMISGRDRGRGRGRDFRG